jgi:hypothetical protein
MTTHAKVPKLADASICAAGQHASAGPTAHAHRVTLTALPNGKEESSPPRETQAEQAPAFRLFSSALGPASSPTWVPASPRLGANS